MATKVIIPASKDGFKLRAPLLLVAEGVAPDPDPDPVDEGLSEDEDEFELEELVPVALSLKASNVLSAVGLTAKTIPSLQWFPCLQ